MKIFSGIFVIVLQQILAVHSQSCGENAVENSCWNPCELTCSNRLISNGAYCTQVCKTGCSCIQGYLRHDNGTCVPQDQCSAPLCFENEQYNECGTCETTCDTYNNTCLNCIASCQPGCYCKEGFVRSTASYPYQCVPVAQCVATKICYGYNEEYDFCPSNCSEDCYYIGTTCTADPSRCCTPACRCKQGYYRYNGACVDSATCSYYG